MKIEYVTNPYTPPSSPMGWFFSWREWNKYKTHFRGCFYCGGPQQTVSALIAWRHRGSRTIGNAVPSCKRCVKLKGQRLLVKWRKEERIHAHAAALLPAAFAELHGLEADHERYLRGLRRKHASYRRRAARTNATSYRDWAAQHPEQDEYTDPFDVDHEWATNLVRINTLARERSIQRERAAMRARNGH